MRPQIILTAIVAVLGTMSVSACSESGGDGSDTTEATDGAEQSTSSEDSSVTFSESGWLVVGEDGAVYTTMLDADGAYRDLRNGDPLYSGEWEKRDDNEVCFVPDEAGKAGDCWKLDDADKDGTVRATNSADRSIELRRISYVGPGEESDAAAAEDAADQQ